MKRNKCIRSLMPLALILCLLLSLTACGGYSISIIKDSEETAEEQTEEAVERLTIKSQV